MIPPCVCGTPVSITMDADGCHVIRCPCGRCVRTSGRITAILAWRSRGRSYT